MLKNPLTPVPVSRPLKSLTAGWVCVVCGHFPRRFFPPALIPYSSFPDSRPPDCTACGPVRARTPGTTWIHLDPPGSTAHTAVLDPGSMGSACCVLCCVWKQLYYYNNNRRFFRTVIVQVFGNFQHTGENSGTLGSRPLAGRPRGRATITITLQSWAAAAAESKALFSAHLLRGLGALLSNIAAHSLPHIYKHTHGRSEEWWARERRLS
eukprot:COSAG01_NODE_3867_length_5609_cov_9.646461_2_plen_209_part_00